MIELIKEIRLMTDLRSLSKELVQKGHVYVGAKNSGIFLKNVRSITVTLDGMPDQVIQENYSLFLIKLEKYLEEKDPQLAG